MGEPIWRQKWRRKVVWLIVVAAIFIPLWLFAAYLAVEQMTSRRRPMYPESPPAGAEPLRLATADGEDLGAWFFEGRPDRPFVLFLHGLGGSRSDARREIELALSAGCAVLAPTLRSHGDSTGGRNDFGYSSRHDAMAAFAWLARRDPARPVVVWGQSMGAAAALFAAPELGPRLRGIIAECPYRDLRTATRHRTRLHLPTGLEYVAYLGYAAVAPRMLGNVDRISPLEAARRVPAGVRVLVLAGEADPVATPAEAAEIAAVLGDRAELRVVQRAGHVGLFDADPAGYRAMIGGFLEGGR